MRQQYEQRAANPHEAMKANELEAELQRTKAYYHKRIRELEDKYKFKADIGTVPTGLSDLPSKDEKTKVITKKQQERHE